MKQLTKRFVENNEANILLTAAEKCGWTIKITQRKEANLAEIVKKSHQYRVLKGSLSVNTNISSKISSNKYLTKIILHKFTNLVPNSKLYGTTDISDSDINQILSKYSKLVVKPVDANNGVGVITGLKTLTEVRQAIKRIEQLGHNYLIIENHIETINEYRIILWKGKIIEILRRIPAHIIGDGHSNIKELITHKNREKHNHFQSLYKPILINDDLTVFLQKQNLTIDSILSTNYRLTLSNTCNLAQGGEVERVNIDSLHPAYYELFTIVYSATGLNYCGVDLITPDLVNEPRVGYTAINELNGAPGRSGSLMADLLENRPFFGAKKLFEAIEQDPPNYY
jgi:D-alanine-D-alanine ligase-like ATP-grasp enzyme